MEMDMEDEMGRTLVQVISEKYNPDNFPYCRGPGAGVVIRTSPQGSPVKGSIFHIHLFVHELTNLKLHTISIIYMILLNYQSIAKIIVSPRLCQKSSENDEFMQG